MQLITGGAGGQTRYTILLASDASSLSTQVNELLARGWQPAGGVTLAEVETGLVTQWAQAMTLTGEGREGDEGEHALGDVVAMLDAGAQPGAASAAASGEEPQQDAGEIVSGIESAIKEAQRSVRRAREVAQDEELRELGWEERMEIVSLLSGALERLHHASLDTFHVRPPARSLRAA